MGPGKAPDEAKRLSGGPPAAREDAEMRGVPGGEVPRNSPPKFEKKVGGIKPLVLFGAKPGPRGHRGPALLCVFPRGSRNGPEVPARKEPSGFRQRIVIA